MSNNLGKVSPSRYSKNKFGNNIAEKSGYDDNPGGCRDLVDIQEDLARKQIEKVALGNGIT